ncbi:MAG: hypothetical protein NT026_01860 [Candidatus Staskawiczbacteria bacterium]|nr:hypothetical protein [Candidatus Staskawiczbacteria bacterium]
MLTKAQFLIEHNKLSPPHLRATTALLTRFQEEKKPQLKDNSWSIEKMRIPFISWLLAFAPDEKKEKKSAKKEESRFRNYPETKFS